MEVEISMKKENPLLKRTELEGTISFTGATPSNVQLADELAKKLNVAKDVVLIRHIYGVFGGLKARFEAVVYASVDDLKKIEPKKKEKAAAAAPAA